MPFIENRGAKIYWDEQGQGPPILLIMGLGYPSDMWHRTRPHLAVQYRTVALDNRGCGRSDVPPGPYSIALMAADAAAVLDAAGVQSAHVFGVSMGGMIAQEFALQYPQRVRCLILGCTSPGGRHAILATPDVLMALMARPTMTAEQAREVFTPILYDSSTLIERIDQDMNILKDWFPTAEGFTAQLQGIMAWEAYSRLPQITVPTLVLHGDSDRLIPPGNGEIVASRIPGARLVKIPRAGHIFGTDQPDTSNQAISEFISQVSGTRA